MKPDAQQCHRIVESFRKESHTLQVALSDWREIIQGLRRKHGSYRDIAEILGANGVQVGQTILRDFCVTELGEPIRKRRRKVNRKPLTPPANNAPPTLPISPSPRPRVRGPRIATLDLIDPSHEQNP